MTLRKSDGSVISVPLDRLSTSDRQHVASLKTAQPAPGPGEPKITKEQLVGKWLMKDGVIEFKANGEFRNLEDKHSWELDGGDILFNFSGKKDRRAFKLSGDRLTLIYSDGDSARAIRLDSEKYGSGVNWQLKDLAGEWSGGDSITLKIDANGKGTCDSTFRVGNTNIANFEFALVEVFRQDDIHLLTIQKMNWILKPSDDRKGLELIAADDKAVNPSSVILKKK